MSLLAGDLLCFGLWLLLFATGTIVFIRRMTPLPIAEKERPLESQIIRTNTIIARILTENDFETRSGFIRTPIGVVSFLPGDHLAIDGYGERLIPVQDMREQYRRIGLTESSGFAQYVFVGKAIENALCGPDEPLRIEIAVWESEQASA